uniref:Coiled-coil protein 142 C-terminal domain-containing protein n=1 Tax=Callorhinchus milii TaxID=7868 RepID=A0A4W3I6F9_CALMI
MIPSTEDNDDVAVITPPDDTEDIKPQMRSLSPLSLTSISPDETVQKEKPDHLNGPGSGPPYSFTKSLQKAEALLWNRLQPGWKWLMKQRAEGGFSEVDSDDSLLSSDPDGISISGKLANVEQFILGLNKCCQLQRGLKGALLQGHVKSLSSDVPFISEFHYHPSISNLGKHYAKLHLLMETRSRLVLNKVYASRLMDASEFVRRLTGLLMHQEHEMSKIELDDISVTSVKGLGGLCEELKCHTNHWKCLGEKIRNDPWLSPQLLYMKENLQYMNKTLTLLSLYAVFLMEQYICTIICTLACSQPSSMSSKSLWEFFHGLEIFNNIVSEFKIDHSYLKLQNHVEEMNVNESDLLSQSLKVNMCRRNGNWHIEPFLIDRVLRILADERGRIAAQHFYEVISTNNTFLSTANQNGLNSLEWENINVPFLQTDMGDDLNFFCGKEIKISLCRPKLGEFCLEDKELMNYIFEGLITSNMLWQLVLNRPKPDQLQESKSETKQNDEINPNPHLSPIRRKSVHWQDSSNSEGKALLLSNYRNMMWKAFGTHLRDQFYLQPWLSYDPCNNAIGNIDQCKAQITVLLTQVLHEACYKVFCHALGSGLKDRCFCDPESIGDGVRSKTAGLFLELFRPLCLAVPHILLPTMTHCLVTVQASSYWLMTKAFQFLSFWSLNQFLLVTQGDLKVRKIMSDQISPNSLQGKKVLKIFSADCKKMTIEIFEQTMPVGRHWRINYRSVELPSNPSEYATAAVQAVIGQVLEGIQPLPEDAQIIPLTMALTAFMEGWMDHILKQKIKFSVQGALQLKQDFDMIRDLIRSEKHGLSFEVRQTLLSLRVFQQMDNAIICLLQQPTRKIYAPSNTWEPFRRCCMCLVTVDFSHGSLNSLDSLDLQTGRTRAILQPEAPTASDLLSKIRATGHPESYLAVNQQEWLALRVGSDRRWKALRLPCMKKSPEQ